ncbi:alpha/beta fold hydrolase [Patescibacteria group bacterium]
MQQHTFELLEKDLLKKLKSISDESHGLDHVENVRKNALKICDFLGLQDYEIDRYLLQFICLIHDITHLYHKGNLFVHIFEGRIVEKIVREYLKSINDLTNDEKEVVLSAVKNHPGSFPYKILNEKQDIYSKILQDSDTLDLFRKERVENLRKNYPLMMFFMGPLFDPSEEKMKNYINIKKNVEILKENPDNFKPVIEHNTDKTEKLVVIPGYADDLNNFKPISKILNDKHIIIVNPPMNRDFKKTYSMNQLVKYLDHVINNHVDTKFDLIGFSFGGITAVEYAKQSSDRLNSILLLNSWPDLSKRYSKRQKEAISYISKYSLLETVSEKIFISDQSRDFVGVPRLTELKKKNYFSKFSTVLENISYNGEKNFNSLNLKKQIILTKDDIYLPYEKYVNITDVDMSYVKILDKVNHTKNAEYWNNLKDILHSFYY